MPDDLSAKEKIVWYYSYALNKLKGFKPPDKNTIASIATDIASAQKTESADGRGMCLVMYPGTDQPDYCHNGMTNDSCQKLAKATGGFARAVIPNSVCPN